MTIPLFAILIIYFLFLIGFVMFAVFNVYHALRFGMASITNLMTLAFFVTGALVIISITTPVIVNTDWNQPLVKLGAAIEQEP